MAQLNAATEDKNTGEAHELTPAQKQEITKFQQEKWKIRKNLRDVQHQLDSDVDKLGTVLKVINTVAVPVLLIIFALLMALWRRYRLRRVAAG